MALHHSCEYLWRHLRGAIHLSANVPVVPLHSTTGYFLASLREAMPYTFSNNSLSTKGRIPPNR